MAATPTPIETETGKVLTPAEAALRSLGSDYTERYGFHEADNYLYKAPKGINREVVETISRMKSEPEWMLDFRLKALQHFLDRPQPTWGSPMLAEVDYDDITSLSARRRGRRPSWATAPAASRAPFTALASPRPSARSFSAVGARTEPGAVTTRSAGT